MEITDMDDATLVQLALKGNEEAKVELLDRCKDTISYHVMKYKQLSRTNLSSFDIEDLISECYLGTLEVIKVYDPSKGASFAHFCKGIIRMKILNFLNRKTLKHYRRKDYEYDLTQATAKQVEDMSERVYTRASDRNKLIVAMFLSGEKQTEIAKRFGIHKTRVMQIIKETVG